MNQNQSSIHILNIVVAHDLFTNYLNANPKGPFGKSEYDARIREYNKKNMLDKEIHLISCKQYLINNMQVMDLDAMEIHGTILDEWLLDIFFFTFTTFT